MYLPSTQSYIGQQSSSVPGLMVHSLPSGWPTQSVAMQRVSPFAHWHDSHLSTFQVSPCRCMVPKLSTHVNPSSGIKSIKDNSTNWFYEYRKCLPCNEECYNSLNVSQYQHHTHRLAPAHLHASELAGATSLCVLILHTSHTQWAFTHTHVPQTFYKEAASVDSATKQARTIDTSRHIHSNVI